MSMLCRSKELKMADVAPCQAIVMTQDSQQFHLRFLADDTLGSEW